MPSLTHAVARWDHDHVHIGTLYSTAFAADLGAASRNAISHDTGWYTVRWNQRTQEWERI